jgi:hypothetical protein
MYSICAFSQTYSCRSRNIPCLLLYTVRSTIFYSYWGQTESTWYCGHYWPVVPATDDRWWWLWSNWWNEDWQGKRKYSEKTCPSATLSTRNPTQPEPGSNLGRRSGKPATNRLNCGSAFRSTLPYKFKHIGRSRTFLLLPKLYETYSIC